MKSKKQPKKKIDDFGGVEKAKRASAKASKVKRAKKPSIYDDPDDIENFVISSHDFEGFNDFDDDDDYY